MKDGRSKPPLLPDEFYWHSLTAAVNRSLHTNYKIEEIRTWEQEDLILAQLWARYAG